MIDGGGQSQGSRPSVPADANEQHEEEEAQVDKGTPPQLTPAVAMVGLAEENE